MWPEDRRVRVWHVGEETVLRLLAQSMTGETEDYGIRCPEMAPLLADLKFYRVQYEWDRRCFAVLIGHPSFAPVPDGMPAPTWYPMYEIVKTTEEAPVVVVRSE